MMMFLNPPTHPLTSISLSRSLSISLSLTLFLAVYLPQAGLSNYLEQKLSSSFLSTLSHWSSMCLVVYLLDFSPDCRVSADLFLKYPIWQCEQVQTLDLLRAMYTSLSQDMRAIREEQKEVIIVMQYKRNINLYDTI
jgi:hypothetical protein